MLAWPASAQEPATDWAAERLRAAELRMQARTLRAEAKKTFDAAHRACWDKILVSSCQEEAKHVQVEVERETRRIDLTALEIERRIAAHDREEKLARRAEKLKERDEKAAKRVQAAEAPGPLK